MVHKEGFVNGLHGVPEHRTDVLNTTYRLTYTCETEDGGGSDDAEQIGSHEKEKLFTPTIRPVAECSSVPTCCATLSDIIAYLQLITFWCRTSTQVDAQ